MFFSDLSIQQQHQADVLTTVLRSALPASEDRLPAVTDNQRKLIIIGQALTPYQVSQTLAALDDIFVPNQLALHPLHNQYGDSVVECLGELQSSDKEVIANMLEQVSTRFHVDIGFTQTTPVLKQAGLLVMDMDSTVIAIECIDEIAKLAGVGDEVAAVTEKAMRGEIAFNESLHHRVACLQGIPLDHLSQIRDSIPIMPGIQTLVNALKHHGWKIAIASGGFTYFADHLKLRLGLDAAVSNTLVVENGVLTGEVQGEIVNADVKARTVNTLAEEWGIPLSQTIAMGDGANDLVMMAASALGVACHGKPVVNKKADVALRHSGLHALLYFLS
jgi:phosphoserine phosphatase